MFTQYSLPYDFGSLEPHIDELTMVTHYTKHHAGYTKNLNTAMAQLPQFDNASIEDILGKLPTIKDATLQTTVRNNGGGFWNHNLYFSILSPKPASKPTGALLKEIEASYNSLDDLKAKVSALGASQFGSGWAWVSVDKQGKLILSSTPNQDNPIMEGTGLTPILGIDVWEHAYYLKYKNLRGDYIKAIWNVIDWAKVSKLYDATR
ncbi:MAG: superoxide dismutase [Sphaerochaetaceae bacterium]|jgi:Fe-Mn family superoxide dismutase|nr:superoxide dismutase [Sphaerochaetaceae bacterium]